MDVQFSHTMPSANGFYLCKAEEQDTLHLVLVVITGVEKPQIILEGKNLFFNEFPHHFFWSPIIHCV
jgi:hypothetical protein